MPTIWSPSDRPRLGRHARAFVLTPAALRASVLFPPWSSFERPAPLEQAGNEPPCEPDCTKNGEGAQRMNQLLLAGPRKARDCADRAG
jgi:hypothetical protein